MCRMLILAIRQKIDKGPLDRKYAESLVGHLLEVEDRARQLAESLTEAGWPFIVAARQVPGTTHQAADELSVHHLLADLGTGIADQVALSLFDHGCSDSEGGGSDLLLRQQELLANIDIVADAIFDRTLCHFPKIWSLCSQELTVLSALRRNELARAVAVVRAIPGGEAAICESEAARAPSGFPAWNGELRELSFGGTVCKRYKQPAPQQTRILEVFQETGWPAKIDDPLPFATEQKRRDRLANAVKGLNAQDPALLRFELDGTSQGIIWKPISPAAE